MPLRPPAEIAIDADLVRTLLRRQAREVVGDDVDADLRKVAEGWDSEIWRLGPRWAVRLPRRALAAPLVTHEQWALPLIGPRVEARGVRVPTPVFHGRPDGRYPWPWSIVAWIDGERALDSPRPARTSWAPALAGVAIALHQPAPREHPINPVRGVPLSHRDAAFQERLAALSSRGTLAHAASARLQSIWCDGRDAPGWAGPPVWIHGDLHPGNLVVRDGGLRGVIDFGDVTAGDPAYDLAVAWLAFDERGRAAFFDALADRYDPDSLTRARAWAASVVVMLLSHSDDDRDYARLGSEAARELGCEPST